MDNRSKWRATRAVMAGMALVATLAGLGGLAGCGGGGSGSPTVSTLSASNVMYGQVMQVSVSGQALDQGIAATVDSGCGAVTAVAGGSDASQQFSCRVNGIGPMTVRVSDSGGKRLATLQLHVPLPQASLTTSKGVIVVELDAATVPLTVSNFLAYLNAGFYRNVIFHRVIQDFVIQAGGFTTGLVGKTATNPPIVLESNRGLSNLRGTIAMARETLPDTATAQFFFNVQDNPLLDHVSDAQPGYAVFGRVLQGLDVIDAIRAVPTVSRAVTFNGQTQILQNVPVDEIVITGASQIR